MPDALPFKAARSVSVLLLALITSATSVKPALAEFQIQEAEWDKGEVELEYRGAYHWGVPGVTEANLNANDLRQSHELEFQWGVTNWFLVQVTTGADQPLGESFNVSSVEVEGEVSMIRREGDCVGLAFQVGYEQAIHAKSAGDEGQANEWAFGPIVELAKGPVLLILNPLFTRQVDQFADAQGLGFQYGWRGVYSLNSRWGLGIEMFGEIEDLANAGSFDSQNHSIGPTLFYTFGSDSKANDVENSTEASEGELSANFGVQFGLTSATSNVAIKVQGSLQF